MPIDITLDKLPAGYAENTGRAGDKRVVSLSGFFSSEDGDDLITRLEGIPQVIVSLILTIGIGGAVISFGNFSLAGIGLASLTGVILNLVLPDKSRPVKIKKDK